MFERPHSRKVKVAEGTAEVRKGERIEGTPMAGEGGAPLAGNLADDGAVSSDGAGTDDTAADDTKTEDVRADDLAADDLAADESDPKPADHNQNF